MKGIVDNESLAVIPQKLIKEFLAGPVQFPGDVQQMSKIFLASDLPGISDLQNPELISSGFFVTTSSAQPTGQDRFVVSGKTTIAYQQVGDMGGFGQIAVYQELDNSVAMRGRYLWYKFVFLCDDGQSE